jgi:hypothetical protein
MLKQSPKATRIARNLRKIESWGERLMCLVTLQERAPHPQPDYCRPGIAGAKIRAGD